jgi:molybdopterin molybdotransferase
MMGASAPDLGLRRIDAALAGEVRNDGDRPHYLRGQLREGVFRIIGRQESHALFGLSRANALLRLKSGENLADGAPVTVEVWD